MSDVLRQKDPSPFVLNLVKPGSTSDDPDRVDKAKTLEARRELSKKGLPQFARSIHEQMSPIRKPTKEEISAIEYTRSDNGFGLCFECVCYDHEAGQEYLANGGAYQIMEAMGSETAVAHLGDWTKYGYCEATNALAEYRGPACQHFQRKKKSLFGKIMGGIWRRKNDI